MTSTLLLLAVLSLGAHRSHGIATNRVNLILDKSMRVLGAATSGDLCDGGLVASPEEKEGSLIWDLHDMFMLHEITITLESKADAEAIDEITAKIGFSDSNFFTTYVNENKDAPLTDKIVLRPVCFEDGQWGAAGSHLHVDFRAKKKFKIRCIEAMGVKMTGQNVMMGKPIRSNNPCNTGTFFINDVFEDGVVKVNDHSKILVDLGKVYRPKEMDVDIKGKWVDGKITLMANFMGGKTVDNCEKKRRHGYHCILDGAPVRFVQLHGEAGLPKIKEIRINV